MDESDNTSLTNSVSNQNSKVFEEIEAEQNASNLQSKTPEELITEAGQIMLSTSEILKQYPPEVEMIRDQDKLYQSS